MAGTARRKWSASASPVHRLMKHFRRGEPPGRRPGATDFGWRLHGQAIPFLPDRSFDLARDGDGSSFLRGYHPGLTTVTNCLQCGACTATCPLAVQGSEFPRRQMTMVRLGLSRQLATDPDIWHCYRCEDCSASCPSGAKPGSVMNALRTLSTEHFAVPRSLARLALSPRSAWLVYCATAALLAVLVAVAGSFAPGSAPITYAVLLPHPVLMPLASAFTVLALAIAGVGARRAWRAWYGQRPGRLRPRLLTRALAQASIEIMAHRKFVECGHSRRRAWAHGALLAGLLGLLVTSGVMAALIPAGVGYPPPMGSPLKIVANVATVLLIGGTLYFLGTRIAAAARGVRSSFFDWMLAVNILAVGLTGLAAELLRVADVRAAAFPAYFIHLSLALALAVLLPYSRLAHATYRMIAITGRAYQALIAQGNGAPAGAGAVAETVPGTPPGERRPTGTAPAPETLLGLGHRELASHSDEEILAGYYQLRDVSEARGGGRYFPNIKRLFGTAFEREKDRREIRALVHRADKPETQEWYEEASAQPCTWWVENEMTARHALSSCMACGMCTSVCPAAEYYEEFDPRAIVDTALSGDEDRLVSLLESEALWYCGQCGSCTGICPRENDPMSLVTSLRGLAQLKGYHVTSIRGRQQYACRHLWAGNLWNRGQSLYFRNANADHFPDFGPRFARWQADQEEQAARVGGSPDRDGEFSGRKIPPETLAELRGCIHAGGATVLWDRIEEHARAQAAEFGLDIDEYHTKVGTEG